MHYMIPRDGEGTAACPPDRTVGGKAAPFLKENFRLTDQFVTDTTLLGTNAQNQAVIFGVTVAQVPTCYAVEAVADAFLGSGCAGHRRQPGQVPARHSDRLGHARHGRQGRGGRALGRRRNHLAETGHSGTHRSMGLDRRMISQTMRHATASRLAWLACWLCASCHAKSEPAPGSAGSALAAKAGANKPVDRLAPDELARGQRRGVGLRRAARDAGGASLRGASLTWSAR